MLRVTPSEVAVMVSVLVPAGVPPPVGGASSPLPQDDQSTAKRSIAAKLTQARRRRAAAAKLASMAKVTTHGSQGSPPCGPGGGPIRIRACKSNSEEEPMGGEGEKNLRFQSNSFAPARIITTAGLHLVFTSTNADFDLSKSHSVFLARRGVA